MPENQLTFNTMRRMSPGDRLFGPIDDLLIILAGITHASSLMVDGQTHASPKPVMRVRTRWTHYGFGLPLRGPLEHALVRKTPSLIEVGIVANPNELTKPMAGAKLQTGGLNDVMSHVISPIYLSFFERYLDWLKANHGEPVTWPPTLNFARVVRNAVAHGKVNFQNQNAPPVFWRDLSYSPADNGHQVIGTDIKLGEMIALMFDVSDELDALAAPIL